MALQKVFMVFNSLLLFLRKTALRIIERSSLCCFMLLCVFTANANDFSYHMDDADYKTLELTINENTVPITVLTYASQQVISKGVLLIVADAEAAGSAQNSLINMAKLLPQWG